MFIEKLRNLWAKTRNTPRDSDDAGFSFAQVIVTMVIVGILGGAIGFTAFQFIGQSRETVLAANIRTAAEAVQNTLALNPNLKTADSGGDARGAASAALLSELGNAAGFSWQTPAAGVGVGSDDADGWRLLAADTPELVRVQFINQDSSEANVDAAKQHRIGCRRHTKRSPQ